MPFFHYSARDAKGAVVEGTIQAIDPNDAARLLGARGYRVASIVDPHAGAPAQSTATALPRYKGSDRQRYFLFSQISNQLRAGISPADVFSTLARQQSNRGFAESLQMIARETTTGKSMSEVMARYPGLYPEHAVGLVRAGEIGGFVPEACAAISEQAGSAQRFRMWHWPLWYAFYSMIVLLPGVAVGMMAFNATFWKVMRATGAVNPASVLQMYEHTILEELRGPPGWIIFGTYLAIIVFLWLLHKPNGKRLRHGMGYRFPMYGKRSTHEGVTLFSWSLSKLARSGIAPQSAWSAAAQCVPNVCLRDRLVDAGHMMRTGSRVSEAAFQSHLFPVEYAPTVTTGELTGDVPGTLERLAQISRSDFDSQTSYALWRMGCLAGLLVFVAQCGGIVVLYYIYTRLFWDVYRHGID